MICQQCRDAGLKSRVDLGDNLRKPDLECRPYWDEEGLPHIHDRSESEQTYRCSLGHVWSVKSDLQPCPQGDYP